MAESGGRVIAVVGATGLQGRAVTRQLSEAGWRVRALTRDPAHEKARAVAELGAELVRADTDDPASLEPAFADVHGVYNVQNHHVSGLEAELAQARNVADVAVRSGVRHLVYAAAGIGPERTGVGSWDVKLDAAAYMRDRELPLTILRPMAFMELMNAPKFFPAASTWNVMPRLMGAGRPVGWLAVDDLAVIAVKAFTDPDRFVGRDLPLTADVRSIEECRQLWREVVGRSPRRMPMPVWLFERFVGTDETTMWRWLRDHEIELDAGPTLELHPGALTVPAWLRRLAVGTAPAVERPRPAEGTL